MIQREERNTNPQKKGMIPRKGNSLKTGIPSEEYFTPHLSYLALETSWIDRMESGFSVGVHSNERSTE
jgi:hypothetical protein